MEVAVNYDNSKARAEQDVEERKEHGDDTVAIRTNIANRKAIERMMQTVEEAFGKIDFLMNNAGVAVDVPIDEMSDEAWDQVIDVNLRGTFLCSQIVARHMMKRKQGRIVNVSAATALRGRKKGANYCAAKAGILALTKCFALEYAPYIKVNTLLPGFTPTEDIVQRFRLHDPAAKENILQTIPFGTMATLDDIAKSVHFLASDFSNYMTGQMLCVNGGSFMG